MSESDIDQTALKVWNTFREIPEIMDTRGELLDSSNRKDSQLEYKMKNAYFLHICRTMSRPNKDELITIYKKEFQ